MSIRKIFVITTMSLVLSACGSGGESSPSAQATDNAKDFNLSALKEQWNRSLSANFQQHGFKGLNSYEVTIGGKTYRGNNLDLSLLGKGLQRLASTEKATATVNGQHYSATTHGTIHLYQQNYSIIGGLQTNGGRISGGSGDYRIDQSLPNNDLEIDTVKGQTTQTLPTVGTFRYSGIAFSQDEQGKLDYLVDFTDRTGKGSISGITKAGNITLNEGKIDKLSHTNPDKSVIQGYGIESNATSEKLGNGNYKLGFFGPNAQEIAGVVSNQHGDVGFGGNKQ